MKYKIEIHTLAGPFLTTAPEGCDDPIKWVTDLLINKDAYLALDDGSIWKSWNREHIVALVQLPPDTTATEQAKAPAPEPNAVKAPQPGRVLIYRESVDYLATDHKIVVLMASDAASRAYFLLYRMNGVPAQEAISQKHFKPIIDAWLEQTNGGYAGEYEVIIPHGTIDSQEEAEAYVSDYIRETKPEHKPAEKTGKAWQGWGDDRGRT